MCGGRGGETGTATALRRSTDDIAVAVDSADAFALAGTLAFVVETSLIGRAVRIGATAEGASAGGCAGLTGGALRMAQAQHDADAVDALLTLGAILTCTAHHTALTTEASSSSAVAVGAASLWQTNAALTQRQFWVGSEAGRTTANGSVQSAAADAVGSAEAVARINAAAAVGIAGRFRRTVVVAVRTGAVGAAPTADQAVRIANGVGRTSADSLTGLHLARSRRMARRR